MNRYTNIILTVIAVALLTIAVENVMPTARADSAITRVALCDPTSNRCASVGVYSSSGNTFFPLLTSNIK
jgi:hypothetical protein